MGCTVARDRPPRSAAEEARGGETWGKRLKALGSTLVLTLLATFHVASPADAASVAGQCRKAYRAEIAACVAAGGGSRVCRKRTLGAPLVPNPVFDYAYSWGVQASDTALAVDPALWPVFTAHNAGS